MPELPDVEIFRQYVNSTALHKKIDQVDLQSRDMLEGVSPSQIKRTLNGERLVSTDRHGKHLFIKTSGGSWLMLHFGMTGFVKYFKNPEKSPAHNRLRLRFSNGYHLAYDCQRKLGEIALTDNPALFVEANDLGPDALDPGFDLGRFRETFQTRRASVKSALMNQKYIAGIGNIYSDEILFQAGVHPGTLCNQLDEDETKTLHSKMHHVLSAAIKTRAEPSRLPSSFIIPHRRGDGICPKCKGRIEKTIIGGRASYYCPQCQQSKEKK